MAIAVKILQPSKTGLGRVLEKSPALERILERAHLMERRVGQADWEQIVTNRSDLFYDCAVNLRASSITIIAIRSCQALVFHKPMPHWYFTNRYFTSTSLGNK